MDLLAPREKPARTSGPSAAGSPTSLEFRGRGPTPHATPKGGRILRSGFISTGTDERVHIGRAESNMSAELDESDSTLGHETANEPWRGT